MAPILKARYSMMSMVHLDSGQCERLDLTHVPQIQNTLVFPGQQGIPQCVGLNEFCETNHIFGMNGSVFDKILQLCGNMSAFLPGQPYVGIYFQILYFNKRVQQVCPDIQRSRVCHEVWGLICLRDLFQPAFLSLHTIA